MVTARVTGNVLATNGELLRFLALKGHGLFLGPSFLVADDLADGSLVRLLPDHRPVEFVINAIYPHRSHLSSKVRIFVDLLADRFAEHHKWMT
jgi:DNA-binding transcriptional LysR family regulator